VRFLISISCILRLYCGFPQCAEDDFRTRVRNSLEDAHFIFFSSSLPLAANNDATGCQAYGSDAAHETQDSRSIGGGTTRPGIVVELFLVVEAAFIAEARALVGYERLCCWVLTSIRFDSIRDGLLMMMMMIGVG